MKKGFTLTEMIAVVGILGFMALLVLPRILNQFNNKKTELSNTMKTMIYTATEMYLDENVETYPKVAGNEYCIRIQDVVDAGYLKTPLTDIETGNEIDLQKKVLAIVDAYSQYSDFEIGNCE